MTLPFGGDGGDRTTTVPIQTIANAAWINFGDLPDGQNKAVIMTAIAMAESSGRPAVIGGGGYGLWQIQNNHVGDAGLPADFYTPINTFNPSTLSTTSYANPLANGVAARTIFDMQGFNAWTVFQTGAFQQFLPQAQAAVQQAATTQGPVRARPTFTSLMTPLTPDQIASNKAGANGLNGLLNNQSLNPTQAIPAAINGMFAGLAPALWIGGGAVLVLLGFVLLFKGDIASIAKVAGL